MPSVNQCVYLQWNYDDTTATYLLLLQQKLRGKKPTILLPPQYVYSHCHNIIVMLKYKFVNFLLAETKFAYGVYTKDPIYARKLGVTVILNDVHHDI